MSIYYSLLLYVLLQIQIILGLSTAACSYHLYLFFIYLFLKQIIGTTNLVVICHLLKHILFSVCEREREREIERETECSPREFPTCLLFPVMCSSIFRSLDIMLLCSAEWGLHTKQEAPKPAAGLRASFA